MNMEACELDGLDAILLMQVTSSFQHDNKLSKYCFSVLAITSSFWVNLITLQTVLYKKYVENQMS